MFLGNSRVSEQIICPQTHVSPLEQGLNTLEREWDQPHLFGSVFFAVFCRVGWGPKCPYEAVVHDTCP